MPQGSTTLHEDPSKLRGETVDRHRAIVSLMEELEAVDWYDQRVDATGDEELRRILEHNRDEEKEHAALLLEWLRRHDEKLAAELRSRLFREGPIVTHEQEVETPAVSDGSLGIGSLKQGR
ncbi:MAG: ferritin [Candidatus Binatia bacterium]|nr:MAG: ferritin [Candidatus Binatia bacterium]